MNSRTLPSPARSSSAALPVNFSRTTTAAAPHLLRQIAILGTFPPRQCGIATYTADVLESLKSSCPEAQVFALAVSSNDSEYDYPSDVALELRDNDPASYRCAARYLNHLRPDVLCVQHEYGIFGGEAGSYLFELLENCEIPVVTVMHTVLADPPADIRAATRRLLQASERVIVMTRMAADILHRVYGPAAVPLIDIIPHGIPDVPLLADRHAKRDLNLDERFVILTFGLLSPGKGIEYAIDAMPEIVAAVPSAAYVILGATHPCLVAREGEAYRNSLMQRARDLGVENHVIFVNQYVEITTLTRYLRAADVYVTPYLNEAQITSGTLAYASGAGCPVVSTPYYHARDLITPDRGFLVPFRDAGAIAAAVTRLSHDPALRERMRQNAWDAGRDSTWNAVGHRFATCFAGAARSGKRARPATPAAGTRADSGVVIFPFAPSRDHLVAMITNRGIWQHAQGSTPDQAHGFCIDDNARTLILAAGLCEAEDTSAEWEVIVRNCLAFMEAALNPDTGRFRNFADADGAFLEMQGSPDSHGRALWACGVLLAKRTMGRYHDRARALLRAALPALYDLPDLRPWAFAALGLAAAQAEDGLRGDWIVHLETTRNRLLRAYRETAGSGWLWFENHLTYDNARLAHGLIAAGAALDDRYAVASGVRALEWLITTQTAPHGHFRAVGCQGWMRRGDRTPAPFDQQPLEAWATTGACLAALQASGDPVWKDRAQHAYRWFLGENDLGLSLYDSRNGGVFDGLHAGGVNTNQGAESLLSFHIAHFELGLQDAQEKTVPGRPANASGL